MRPHNSCMLLGLMMIPSAMSAGEMWALGACSSAHDAQALQATQHVLTASPTSDLYVPHPFPTDVNEAFADFKHQYVQSWSTQARRHIPPDDRWLLSLVKSDALTAELLTVANWTPSRCGRILGTKSAFLLLRLRLQAGGGEVARIVLLESGLLHSLRLRRDQRSFAMVDGHNVESLTGARDAATARALAFEQPQYVALTGLTMPCSEANPCVAFRDGDRVFVFRSGKVFELSHLTDRFSVQEFIEGSVERLQLESMRAAGQHAVSLGGDEMTLATELLIAAERP